MKRFVTYLYQYEQEKKVKNTGFAKIEYRNGQCKVELIVKGMDDCSGTGTVYFFMKNEQAVPIGEIMLERGRGEAFLLVSENQCPDLSWICGLAIKMSGGEYIASCWLEHPSERLIRGDFGEVVQEERKKEGLTYRKIELEDIRSLPAKHHHLSNNPFLLYGYYQYQYLIYKEVFQDGKLQEFLGVPGVLEQPERLLAMIYGFYEFEPAEQAGAIEGTQLESGSGYYLYPIKKELMEQEEHTGENLSNLDE